MKLDAIIERYVKLRDKKAQLKAAFDTSVADINTALERCEAVIMQQLDAQGVESIRTDFGTAFKSVTASATVADWELTLDFIRQNELWDMLEKRVSKASVEQYKLDNNDLPPGINYRQAVSLNVRRA